MNPVSAIGFELAFSVPTAVAGAEGLTRLGVTSAAKQGALEREGLRYWFG